MKTITSRDNAQYKELLKLAGSSQARRKSGRTLLDGVHLCQSYLQLRGMPEQCIVSEAVHFDRVVDRLASAFYTDLVIFDCDRYDADIKTLCVTTIKPILLVAIVVPPFETAVVKKIRFNPLLDFVGKVTGQEDMRNVSFVMINA